MGEPVISLSPVETEMTQQLPTLREIIPVSGNWRRLSDRLAILRKEQTVVYRSEQEPGFVIWCVTWKEPDGQLKVCFSEATGDLTNWPPNYDFTLPSVSVRRRIFASCDGGRSWQDTCHGYDGRCGDWRLNCDSGHQNMIRLPDGRLLRSNRGYDRNRMRQETHPVYDERKAQEACSFPFTYQPMEVAVLYPRFLVSQDEGDTWQELSRIDTEFSIYVTGLHQLKNGLIVATGARVEGKLPDGYKAILMESSDDGRTWSQPQVFGENNEVCRGLCEESDFVELEDGTLLLINRVVRSDGADVLFHLRREENGHWTTLSERCPEHFIRTGYPIMLRASDGTIFHDRNTSLLYSCDDGESWEVLPLALTYYGRLLEAAPGRILNLTQNNIGDSPFPWWYDTDIQQNAFEYRRYARFSQDSPDGGTMMPTADALKDFHLCALVKTGEKVQFLWGEDERNGHFAQLEVRDGKNLFFVMGILAAGQETALRSYCLTSGGWDKPAEIQLDCAFGRLQAAVKLSEGDWSTGQNPACYLTIPTGTQTEGRCFVKIGGMGELGDLRLARQGGIHIRDNWQTPSAGSRSMELDAGRTF